MEPFIVRAKARELVRSRAEKAVQLYNEKHGTAFPVPLIIWRHMGYRMAGRACRNNITGRDWIEMNYNYLFSPDYREFLRETILHELAHIIAGFDHGRIWRECAKDLGDTGDRLHNYATPLNRPGKTLIAYCPECGQKFEHWAKSRRDLRKYVCGNCQKDGKEIRLSELTWQEATERKSK